MLLLSCVVVAGRYFAPPLVQPAPTHTSLPRSVPVAFSTRAGVHGRGRDPEQDGTPLLCAMALGVAIVGALSEPRSRRSAGAPGLPRRAAEEAVGPRASRRRLVCVSQAGASRPVEKVSVERIYSSHRCLFDQGDGDGGSGVGVW